MGRVRRSRTHRGIRDVYRKSRTRARTKDMDQIHADLKLCPTDQQQQLTPLDEDKPGGGQFYCVECARYFMDELILETHKKSKQHKRRVHELKTEPAYSQAEAEAAAGLGTDKGLKTRETAAAQSM